MSWNYTGDPSACDVAAIRFEIQDTDSTAQLFSDEEIAYSVISETGVSVDPDAVSLQPGQLFSAAARCCEVLARNLARQANSEVGQMKTSFDTQAQTFAERAAELRAKAIGLNAPYAGGQSISEKQGWAEDCDLPQPKFRRGQFDNHYAGGASSSDRGALPPMPN